MNKKELKKLKAVKDALFTQANDALREYNEALQEYREKCRHSDILEVDGWWQAYDDDYGSYAEQYYCPGSRLCLTCGIVERGEVGERIGRDRLFGPVFSHDKYGFLTKEPKRVCRALLVGWYLYKNHNNRCYFYKSYYYKSAIPIEVAEELRNADLSWSTFTKEYYGLPYKDRPVGF